MYSIAFSPDGRWLATGAGGKTVRIWDLETGLPVRYLLAGTGPHSMLRLAHMVPGSSQVETINTKSASGMSLLWGWPAVTFWVDRLGV